MTGELSAVSSEAVTSNLRAAGENRILFKVYGNIYCAKNQYMVTGTSDGLYVSYVYSYDPGDEAEYFDLNVHEP